MFQKELTQETLKNVAAQATENLIKEGAEKITKDSNSLSDIPMIVLGKAYVLAQKHPKIAATFGGIGALGAIAYCLWRDHHMDHLTTLWGYILDDYNNQKNEHKKEALEKVNCKYRTWLYRRNQTLRLNVERFYNTAAKDDDDRRKYVEIIKNECFPYCLRFIYSWWIS